MNESTTTPASPVKSRQDPPPKWAVALVWIGVAALALWGMGSCAEGMSDGYQDHVGQCGSAAPVAVPPAVGEVDTDVLAFQAALDAQGVPMARSPQMVQAGRSACEALDEGASPEQLALVAHRSTNEGAGFEMLTLRQAGFIVGASVGAFCPRHDDKVR